MIGPFRQMAPENNKSCHRFYQFRTLPHRRLSQ